MPFRRGETENLRLHIVRDEFFRLPKLPRDITGLQLANTLSRYGYRVVRQAGSHIRLTRDSDIGSSISLFRS
jgi:hypothetical protein